MLFWKKGTSPANEFILHEQKEKAKMHFFFQIWKKCTNHANEFPLHKCRNNKEM